MTRPALGLSRGMGGRPPQVICTAFSRPCPAMTANMRRTLLSNSQHSAGHSHAQPRTSCRQTRKESSHRQNIEVRK